MREDGSGTNTYNIEAISSSDSDTSDTDDDDHAYSQNPQPPPAPEENDVYALIPQPTAERAPVIEYRPSTPSYHPIAVVASDVTQNNSSDQRTASDSLQNAANSSNDIEMNEEFSDMEALSSEDDDSSSSCSNSASSNSMNNDEPLAGYSSNLEPVNATWSSSNSSSSSDSSDSSLSHISLVIPDGLDAI